MDNYKNMKSAIIFVMVLSSLPHGYGNVVEPTGLWCKGSTMHELRIQGCQQQPCTIRKGERLPFEIDFSFEAPPLQADRFSFNIYISYYAVRPGYYGSSLSSVHCREGQCQLNANTRYTLKNGIYIDPRAECTAGCDGMSADGTGKRKTNWRWTLFDSKSNSSESAVCRFDVELNIIK